ncbi:hypothetical protein DSECCO2_407530 [anaerobic digester metagenome]
MISAFPEADCEQLLASSTLTNEYVKRPTVFVGAGRVTELPEIVVMVWLPPPLILNVNV